MLIVKMLFDHLRPYYIILILTYAINFNSAQYFEHFLNSAFNAGRRFPPQDVVNSAFDVSKGLLLSASRTFIPTPVELFDMGINLIVGFPIEQTFVAINTFCKCSLITRIFCRIDILI